MQSVSIAGGGGGRASLSSLRVYQQPHLHVPVTKERMCLDAWCSASLQLTRAVPLLEQEASRSLRGVSTEQVSELGAVAVLAATWTG